MPSGVEHRKTSRLASASADVRPPSMPSGVEHSVNLTEGKQVDICATPFDALGR